MNVLKRFVRNVAACYTPPNILLQLLAGVLTYFLVTTGFDWYWFTHTRDAALQNLLFPAAIVGGLLPMLLPVILYLAGKVLRNPRVVLTAFAVAQAALIGLLVSSFYKVFTGRIPPPFRSQALVDISHQFNFGILRDGAFWGWPSSHTTVAFAVALTLAILYKHSPLVKYTALLVALYIGVGVSTNIHWFSEFLAGAIIGSVIGVVVGRSYRGASLT